jgi:hypothetical protein
MTSQTTTAAAAATTTTKKEIRQAASCGFTISKLCCTLSTVPFQPYFLPVFLSQIGTVVSFSSSVHCTTTIGTTALNVRPKINSLLLANPHSWWHLN